MGDDANQDANKDAEDGASSSDSDAPISRGGSALIFFLGFLFIGLIMLRLPAIALAQQAAAAARARADAAGPSLKKPSAFLAESSDEGEARPPKAVPASKSAAVAGQATLFSFLQGRAK